MHCVAMVFNGLTAAAAVTGAVVAVLGLRAWQTQLRGRAEYDLAKRLYRTALLVRDAIARARNPLISGGEIKAAFKRKGVEVDDGDPDQVVYEMRWDGVAEAVSTFRAELLEAEVVWGTKAKEAGMRLIRLVVELHTALSLHLRSRMEDNPLRPPVAEPPDLGAIVFSGFDDDDVFESRIQDAIGEIEAICRPALDLKARKKAPS